MSTKISPEMWVYRWTEKASGSG